MLHCVLALPDRRLCDKLSYLFCRCDDPVSVAEVAEGVLKRDDCQVTFDPPEGMDANSSLCYSQEISECNTTGVWATYDPEIEWACHQYAMRYTFITFIKKERKM